MNIIEKITKSDEISLITLYNVPSDISFIADIFQQIADNNISVDIISQSVPLSDLCSLSFTIPDNDLEKIFDVISNIRKNNPGINSVISSSNHKLTVYGEKMNTAYGIAAKVFKTAADYNADIRIINTSETDISLIISNVNSDQTLEEIKKALK